MAVRIGSAMDVHDIAICSATHLTNKFPPLLDMKDLAKRRYQGMITPGDHVNTGCSNDQICIRTFVLDYPPHPGPLHGYEHRGRSSSSIALSCLPKTPRRWEV